MSQITIYKSDSCGACREVVPLIKRLAGNKGIPVKIIDIDKCHTEQCNQVEYVPRIEMNGREVSTSQLEKILS